MTSADAAGELARQAFQAAMNGNLDSAWQDLLTISNRFGEEGVGRALLLWIDQVVQRHEMKDLAGSGMVPVPVFLDGDKERPADDMSPEEAWAGRLIAARAMNDGDMFNAVLASVPEDGTNAHLGVLLSVCAKTVRLMLGIPDEA